MANGEQQDLQSTLNDPEFQALSDDEQVEVLKRLDAAGLLTKAAVPGTLGSTYRTGPTGFPELPSARSQALKQAETGGLPQAPKSKQPGEPPPETPLTKMEPSFFGGAPMTEKQSKFASEKLPGALKTMSKYKWETLGTVAGGELGEAFNLGRLAKSALTAAGTAAGNVTGKVASGEKPSAKEALTGAAITGAGGYALDLGTTLAAKFIQPFLTKAPLPATEEALASQVSTRASDLVKLADAEEGIRTSVTAAPKAIREQVIKKAYSGLTGEIDLMPIGESAEGASEKLLAHKTPPSMSKVIQITRAIKAAEGEVMDLISEGDADPEELQGAARTLMQLEKRAKVSVADAIQLRSALSRVLATARRAHAPGEAQLVPGEVYQAVKTVKSQVDDAINTVAAAQGKTGYLKMADKIYSQFMNDFYNQGAPLKGVTNLKPEMVGKTLDSLLKPENINRAEEALRRWGMKDQADALRKIADRSDRKEAVSEMKDLLTSPQSYKSRTTGALREADTKRVADAVKALRDARKNRLIQAGVAIGVGTEARHLYDWLGGTASARRRLLGAK